MSIKHDRSPSLSSLSPVAGFMSSNGMSDWGHCLWKSWEAPWEKTYATGGQNGDFAPWTRKSCFFNLQQKHQCFWHGSWTSRIWKENPQPELTKPHFCASILNLPMVLAWNFTTGIIESWSDIRGVVPKPTFFVGWGMYSKSSNWNLGGNFQFINSWSIRKSWADVAKWWGNGSDAVQSPWHFRKC